MNKVFKYSIASVIVIIVLIGICWVTGIIRVSKKPSAANDPGIPTNASIVYSKWISPERFDFICFKGILWKNAPVGTMVSRLCGMPGDVLEMKRCELFINGKPVDEKFPTRHTYILTVQKYLEVKKALNLPEHYARMVGKDSMNVELLDSDARAQGVTPSISLVKIKIAVDSLFKNGAHDWTVDNFGPLTIPADSYFVLGDNRNAATDSRYRGFIKKSDFQGTVIKVF